MKSVCYCIYIHTLYNAYILHKIQSLNNQSHLFRDFTSEIQRLQMELQRKFLVQLCNSKYAIVVEYVISHLDNPFKNGNINEWFYGLRRELQRICL